MTIRSNYGLSLIRLRELVTFLMNRCSTIILKGPRKKLFAQFALLVSKHQSRINDWIAQWSSRINILLRIQVILRRVPSCQIRSVKILKKDSITGMCSEYVGGDLDLCFWASILSDNSHSCLAYLANRGRMDNVS